ncbi:hypothetical protein PSHT_10598 [Puccinia striiformis]|uniref:Velvet domain-containing protein n=2 Tax=Puccinia striiformis TaxID=27350 RepID=A0A2S4V8R4_9BASI|nr:hypothetical protein PSTT_14254 [Puccinia striiformis]POW05911.1 hypothetical protein PSHT_10598 [Puccinia striiformis]
MDTTRDPAACLRGRNTRRSSRSTSARPPDCARPNRRGKPAYKWTGSVSSLAVTLKSRTMGLLTSPRRSLCNICSALEPAEAMRLILTPHILRVEPDGSLSELPRQGINLDPPPSAIMDRTPPQGESRWLFVFGDIGVQNLGQYVLRFSLWPIEDRGRTLCVTGTVPFQVVPRGQWPLRPDWYTPLSARLNANHPHLKIYAPRP